MQIQIQLTLKDYVQGFRAHMGLSYFFFPVVGALLMISGAFHSLIEKPTVSAFGAFVFGAGFAFFLPLTLRRQFKSNRKLSCPFSIKVSSEGVEMVSEYGDSRASWNAFLQFVENDTMFLLYSQPNFFFIFPKRFFSPEQLSDFGKLVHASLRPKGRGKNTVRTLLVWAVLIISIFVLYRVIQNSGH